MRGERGRGERGWGEGVGREGWRDDAYANLSTMYYHYISCVHNIPNYTSAAFPLCSVKYLVETVARERGVPRSLTGSRVL